MIVKSPPVSNDKEAFYFIIDHLKKQDCKSQESNSRSGCMYRIEEYNRVLKCAIGALISVHEYGHDLEDQTIQFDGEVYAAVADSNPDWRVTENSVDMMTALQRLHDEIPVYDWGWVFDVIEMAIEEFGFDNIVYRNSKSKSSLYAIVSMAQELISEHDTRLTQWNFVETSLEWFDNARQKVKVMQ